MSLRAGAILLPKEAIQTATTWQPQTCIATKAPGRPTNNNSSFGQSTRRLKHPLPRKPLAKPTSLPSSPTKFSLGIFQSPTLHPISHTPTPPMRPSYEPVKSSLRDSAPPAVPTTLSFSSKAAAQRSETGQSGTSRGHSPPRDRLREGAGIAAHMCSWGEPRRA